MINKYLFIANDVWFDFDQFMKDTKGDFWWFNSPKTLARGERVYLYQAGGTKAIRYEFEIIDTKKQLKDIDVDYDKYVKPIPGVPVSRPKEETLMCRIKLVREIKDIKNTSPKMLKEKGNLLGSLISPRTLRPYTIEYLDKLK